MKPKRVTEQLWQQWEERQRGQVEKLALGRLENEGVRGVRG